MADDHVSCPKCGYDLYGIPKGRCPECGFGFDRAALRTLRSAVYWHRLSVVQTIRKCGSLAVAILLPSYLDYAVPNARARILYCAAAQIAIYVFTSKDYGRLSPKQWADEWMRDSRGYGLCILGSFVAWLPLPIRIAGVAALLPILFAWGLRVWDWPAIADSIHVVSKSFRATVTQTDLRALTLLVATSMLCNIALV